MLQLACRCGAWYVADGKQRSGVAWARPWTRAHEPPSERHVSLRRACIGSAGRAGWRLCAPPSSPRSVVRHLHADALLCPFLRLARSRRRAAGKETQLGAGACVARAPPHASIPSDVRRLLMQGSTIGRTAAAGLFGGAGGVWRQHARGCSRQHAAPSIRARCSVEHLRSGDPALRAPSLHPHLHAAPLRRGPYHFGGARPDGC
jgi:hypothetical protein